MTVKDHFLSGEQFELTQTAIKGILKTTPLPPDLSRYYESENYISHHQDSGSLKEKIYKLAQSFNLNYKRNILGKQLFKGALVLDYGCGAGEFIRYISGTYSVLGYEPNHDARAAASKKVGQDKLISNIDTLRDGSLDAITLWHVFEHIENQYDILNKFHKKLKSNGLLVIAVPNHTSYDAQYYKDYWAAYDVPRHVFHFSKNGIEQLFNNSHWQLMESKPLLLDSYYISIISEKYKKSTFFWLKGSIIGAISNIKASKNGEFSSLIYLIKKI